MKFGLVGDLEEAVLLARVLSEREGDSIVGSHVSAALAERLVTAGVTAPAFPSNDELILYSEVEAVIVAASDCDESIRLVRRATQEDRHVVALVPNGVSTAYSYELHLLLDEGLVGIVVLSGRWYAPLAPRLAELDQAARRLKCELPLLADKDLQRRNQIHAIDAMCGAGFRFTQVTGLDINGSDQVVQSRTVTLASSQTEQESVPPATIQFDPDGRNPATVDILVQDGGEHSCATALPCPATAPDVVELRDSLGQISATLTDRPACQQLMEKFSNSLELLEGLDKSLRRRRTVDVYLDSVSERAVFKTQMTAIGCGILAWMIFGMVAYLIIAQVLEVPPTMLYVARILWFTPLVLFLAAQLLLPLARERGDASTAATDENSSVD